MGGETSERPWHEIVNEIIRNADGIPDHEIIGYLKGVVSAHPGLSDPDREALFLLTSRAGDAAKPFDRGDIHVSVKNVQNANSSATASPQVSQTVNVSPSAAATALPDRGAASSVSGATSNETKADRDGMTTLLRREAFDAELPRLLATANGTGAHLSLIMIDVDKFKLVNDTHGHQKGDAVLQDAGRCVAMMVGSKGTAYRYGGEELAVALPDQDAEQAAQFAERLRSVLQAQRPGGLDITVSLGVATCPVHATTLEDLVGNADKALYAAKEGGRNQVRVHGIDGPFKPQP